MILGDAAYVEYIATLGPAYDGAPIAFPTYEPPRRVEESAFTPVETMLLDLQKAVREQLNQWNVRLWRRAPGVRISMPLAFADAGYAELFEHDFLYSTFALQDISADKYEFGVAALAARGGLCFAPAHPLRPAISWRQPLARFAAAAMQALSQLDVHRRSPIEFDVHFGCSVDFIHHQLQNQWQDPESDGQLMIGDGIQVTSNFIH